MGGQVAVQRVFRTSDILAFCREPRTLQEIMAQLGIRKRDHAMLRLRSLMAAGFLAFTVPEKPKSRRQKYIATALGLDYADQHPADTDEAG